MSTDSTGRKKLRFIDVVENWVNLTLGHGCRERYLWS